jgi:hypothetical protein
MKRIAILFLSTVVTAAAQGTDIIPADRVTTWNPGLNAVGGIPHRTTVYKTLSPSGGDDTAAIQNALDNCPSNEVVQLTAGTFNITGNGLNFQTSNVTLRGSGPGSGGGTGGTRLIKADRDTNPNYAILYVGAGGSFTYGNAINLAADAVKGTNSATLASNPGLTVGECVLVDINTDNDPDVWWGPEHDPPGGGSRRWFCRQDRSISQILEITAVSGNTITFATPFHTTFPTKYQAQLTRNIQDPGSSVVVPFMKWSGIEDIYFYGGMGGDYHGNVAVSNAAYCWIKHIEAHWSTGTSVGLYSTYRCEVRDSYIHETPDPNPGGAGYLAGINAGASDNLMENNIMWYGNKVVVMRASGGGNVFAYNYTDDAFGSTYPNMPEAGINAGHYTTPHMELLEGNYSHNYKGDTFWGNSIDITVFRNHLSAIRAAHTPLNTYMSGPYPYMDLEGRTAVDVQAQSYRTNFVGNVLGFKGQTLLSYNSGGYSYTQTSWQYENLSNFAPDGVVPMWNIGSQQAGGWIWVPTTYQTQLRDGNWDWATQSQRWHGIGGAVGAGTPQTIPNSLYLKAKPAFFGSYTWPWVDPTTGSVYILPAKKRFEDGTPNQSNGGPVITSGPSATPNPALVGQSVAFSAAATDVDGSTPTYAWVFGDGATGSGAAASHSFSTAGTYTSNVTVTDAAGLAASKSVSVVVTAASSGGGGGGSGSGGGGGSSGGSGSGGGSSGGGSSGGGSGSGGGASGNGTTFIPMTLSKMQGSAKFTGGHDSCSLAGVIPNLPAGFNPTGQTLTLNIGGAIVSFTLNSKGSAKASNGTIALRLKPSVRNKTTKQTVFQGGNVQFAARILGGTWASTWGLSPTATGKNLPMPISVTIGLGGNSYMATATAKYTPRKGAGKFKL